MKDSANYIIRRSKELQELLQNADVISKAYNISRVSSVPAHAPFGLLQALAIRIGNLAEEIVFTKEFRDEFQPEGIESNPTWDDIRFAAFELPELAKITCVDHPAYHEWLRSQMAEDGSEAWGPYNEDDGTYEAEHMPDLIGELEFSYGGRPLAAFQQGYDLILGHGAGLDLQAFMLDISSDHFLAIFRSFKAEWSRSQRAQKERSDARLAEIARAIDTATSL